jgi:hypothetical protein
MDSESTPPVRKVVPAPHQKEVDPDDAGVEGEGWILPQLPPEVRACFDHFDAMTKGMTPDEILALLPDMYLDAEGFPRIRRQQIRAVPDLD